MKLSARANRKLFTAGPCTVEVSVREFHIVPGVARRAYAAAHSFRVFAANPTEVYELVRAAVAARAAEEILTGGEV